MNVVLVLTSVFGFLPSVFAEECTFRDDFSMSMLQNAVEESELRKTIVDEMSAKGYRLSAISTRFLSWNVLKWNGPLITLKDVYPARCMVEVRLIENDEPVDSVRVKHIRCDIHEGGQTGVFVKSASELMRIIAAIEKLKPCDSAKQNF